MHRYDKQLLKERPDLAEDAEPIELHDRGHGYADTGLVVLDIGAARARVTKWLVANKMARDEFDGEEYAREMIDECIAPLLFKQPARKAGG